MKSLFSLVPFTLVSSFALAAGGKNTAPKMITFNGRATTFERAECTLQRITLKTTYRHDNMKSVTYFAKLWAKDLDGTELIASSQVYLNPRQFSIDVRTMKAEIERTGFCATTKDVAITQDHVMPVARY